MTLIKFQNPGFRSMVDAAWAPSSINQLMDSFLGTAVNAKSNLPAVNVIENTEMYLMEFSVPGFKREELTINLEENLLTVKGNHLQEEEEKQEKFTRKEFSKVSFSRSFSLPETVDASKLEAKFEDGLLHVILPKKSETKKETAITVEIK